MPLFVPYLKIWGLGAGLEGLILVNSCSPWCLLHFYPLLHAKILFYLHFMFASNSQKWTGATFWIIFEYLGAWGRLRGTHSCWFMFSVMFAACLPFIACKNIVLFTFYVCFKFSKMNWCHFLDHIWIFGGLGPVERDSFLLIYVLRDVCCMFALYCMQKYCFIHILCLLQILKNELVPLFGPYFKIWGLGAGLEGLILGNSCSPWCLLHVCPLLHAKRLCYSHSVFASNSQKWTGAAFGPYLKILGLGAG